jgi:hypothetical protein
MKMEYYLNAFAMLSLQLKEEEEHFQRALKLDKQFWEIREIKQRMRSLKSSLLTLDKWLQNFTK